MNTNNHNGEVSKDKQAEQVYLQREFLKTWCQRNRMPLPECMSDIVCRGCKELGTACGTCSKCMKENTQ